VKNYDLRFELGSVSGLKSVVATACRLLSADRKIAADKPVR